MLDYRLLTVYEFRNLRIRHYPLQWRHNERDGVSNHQPHDCLLNRLFRRKSKKASKLRVTGICAGTSPVTDYFPALTASNAEKSFHLMTSSCQPTNTLHISNRTWTTELCTGVYFQHNVKFHIHILRVLWQTLESVRWANILHIIIHQNIVKLLYDIWEFAPRPLHYTWDALPAELSRQAHFKAPGCA